MKKSHALVTILAVLAGLCLIVSPCWAQTNTYTLRIQCVYPEASHGAQTLKKFAAKVEEYTKGQVQVKLFWPGMLVSLQEGYDALAKGTIEGLYSSLIYYGGTVPEGKTEWLPFNWFSPDDCFDIYYNVGYLDLMREANAQHNVYYLFPLMTASMGCMTKFVVNTMDDFKGKKMRATGVDGAIVKAMGSAAVTLPATELYATLQRGTVDGVVYPYYTLKTYKLHEVVNQVVLPGVHTPAISGLYLNLAFWKSLPRDLQHALEQAGKETALLAAQACPEWDKEGIDEAQGKGIRVTTLSKSDLKKLQERCMPLWDQVAKSTPINKKIIELLMNYQKKKSPM
ncbi:MAG: TRAP transporter substrate-binding protein DctP [Thermodesulfobacteriota bacterium]